MSKHVHLFALLLAIIPLVACDRTPPTDEDMRQALQASIDGEAQAGGSQAAKLLKIATFKAENCDFTAMVGKPIYRCDVTVAFLVGDHPGRTLPPRPVMFHKVDDHWVVPN